MIVASRGRDPDDPSDRTTGNPNLVQRFETNYKTSNALSTVHKDNMVARALRARDYKGAPSPRYHYDKAEFNLIGDNKLRRLTPNECEKLQGFPDNWTEGVSDTQRYKQLGNAVTTKVITAIAERLIYK
jgi:site-specific DNA-cytosine methylase